MNAHAQRKSADGMYSSIMRSRIFSFLSGRGWPGRRLVGIVGCLLFAMLPAVWGQASDQLSMATRGLTNLGEIWTVPHEHRDEEYRIQTEVVIYYFDAEWGNASGECLGIPRWLPIFDSPIPLKAGQRIAIDGVIVPLRERFVWAQSR